MGGMGVFDLVALERRVFPIDINELAVKQQRFVV